MSQHIDKHDVRAFCDRSRELIDSAERAATKAVSEDWLEERRDAQAVVGTLLDRAIASLEALRDAIAHTIDADEAEDELRAQELLPDD